MEVNKCLHFLVLLATLQITNSDSSLNETHSSEGDFKGTHRIIKRYTQHFHFPRHRIPTVPRPNFPMFPVFGPPPGQHVMGMGGDPAFPKIRLRPPTDENLFTEEEEDEEEQVSKRKKKLKKKPKGNKRLKPQLQSDSALGSESVEEKVQQEKGESGELTKSKGKGEKTTSSSDSETTVRPKTQKDRTILTSKVLLAKKAMLAKAVILSNLKQPVAYGLSKISKVKGISVKAPGVVFSVGATNVEALSGKVTSEDGEEDDDDDEDIEDVLEVEGGGEDDPVETGGTTEGGIVTDNDAIIVTPAVAATSDSSNESLNANTNSMMQQLQEQLQQKQQVEQHATPQQSQEYIQNQNPLQTQPERPELYQPQGQMKPTQVQQYQQAPGIQIEYTPGAGENLAILGAPSPEDVEYLTGSKSKGSKKAKKKAKKAKPRPVNLGVKANLYKKFDQLAKQAQSKLSTFIQIDVDFLSRRSATKDDAEPDKLASRTLEVSAETGSSSQSDEKDVPNKFHAPGNVPPPWIKPVWRRKYPRREESEKRNCGEGKRCQLNPVWILFGKGAS